MGGEICCLKENTASALWLQSKWSRKLALVRASYNNCLHWWGEKFASLNKILPVHHECNPNGQELLHKLKIRTAFSKNWKMNFCLEIKLTMNLSWFRLCEPKINTLKSEWTRKLELVRARSKNCLNWWGEKFAAWKKILPVHYGCNPNGQGN